MCVFLSRYGSTGNLYEKQNQQLHFPAYVEHGPNLALTEVELLRWSDGPLDLHLAVVSEEITTKKIHRVEVQSVLLATFTYLPAGRLRWTIIRFDILHFIGQA
ncbi:MAG: hypothetical protein ACNS60_07920 [Candidatus Cyclobacteriaceae bacterium M2_1C_046]